ncbi:hypothetical protein C474_08147 [Halogeometricum pallidum JCM 14848]|uniref:Right handed beta helix domain-containing protein n=1 Tax=Halogeometricum pallidum JCM 14848 TaxID=1227487 RepID=M0DBT2_HALPD|nr:hypothetical protein [Halogeometricum pallidum]ELZ31629.1 hypothetical protein C474_08147 [Halogeometricum pallidum JCM 14848]
MAENPIKPSTESPTEPTNAHTGPKLIDRRNVLRLGAATAAVAATGVGSAAAAGGYTYEGISFDRKVNAVDDLGLDPNGGALVDDALGAVPSGTLVEFPTGRYLVDSCWVRSSNVGLVAADGADPVFVPAKPQSESESWTILMKTGGDHVFAGFEFDYTREGYGGTLIVIAERGDYYIGDVHVKGVVGHSCEGLSTAVEDPNGTGVIERFYARDGSTYDSASHGLFVGLKHAGTLYIRDCEVWNWTDNGVYASSPGYIGSYRGTTDSDRGDGEVHIEGGVFKNNNISNVRIGSTNSSVRGAVIHNEKNISADTWDSRNYDIMPRSGTEPEPVVNSRGIWLANRTNLLVEDCDIRMDTGVSSGAIVAKGATGNCTIRNTRIQVNTTDVLNPIVVAGPSIDWPDTAYTFENVSVTGVGGGRKIAVAVTDRPGTSFRNCCISLDGADQNGIKFIDTSSGVVADTNIGVDGRSTLFQNSTISTSNVSTADACPVPSLSGSGANYGGSKELPYTLTVRGTGAPLDYRIVTTDGINQGSHLVDEDVPTVVEGSLDENDQEDWFWFSGEVTEVSLSDEATLFIEGEPVDPADYAPEGDDSVSDGDTVDNSDGSVSDGDTVDGSEIIRFDGTRKLTHTTTVRSTGAPLDYRVVTTQGINQGSHIVENEVSTSVEGSLAAGDEDWFWFAGEIVSVELSDDAAFFVNGEKLDPADYAPEGDAGDGSVGDDSNDGGADDGSTLEHVLYVDGSASRNTSHYSFTVTGDIERSEELSTVPTDAPAADLKADEVLDGRVEGTVAEGVDAYRFSGSITQFDITGFAIVDFEN